MRIDLANISIRYNEKPPLFSKLNLSINSGDFVIIQGPSGSGKSSLLRLLNRLQEPSEGEIRIDGTPIDQSDVLSLRRKIGYIQQSPIMVETTVEDNLLLPFQFRAGRLLERPKKPILRELLDDLLLKHIALTDEAVTLSLGEKQRLAFIRVLLTQPEVILCDEPASALDNQSRAVVENRIEQMNIEQNATVVMATHLNYKPKKVSGRYFDLTPGKGLEEVKR